MDLSFPLCVFSLLLLGYSYAQQILILPEEDAISQNFGDKFQIRCKAMGLAAGENPSLEWLDQDNNVIGAFVNDENSPNSRKYVVSFGSNQLSLWFDSMDKRDVGKYTCRGTINGKVEFKDIQINLKRKLQVHSKENQSPIIYTRALIECDTTGSPSAEIVWLFGDTRNVIQNSTRYVYAAKGLYIDNITREDNGVYICSIFTTDGKQSLQLDVTVTVTVPPKMKSPAEISDPIVGREFTMSCGADGEPRPQFKFYKGTTLLDKGRFTVTVDDNPQNPISRGTLKIDKLEDTDEGEYKCVAVNNGGNVTDKVFVNTIVPPTIRDIENKTAPENSATVLACEARSDPAADVQWKITGTDISIIDDPDNGIRIEEQIRDETLIHIVTKLLKFSSLKPSNTNNYTCTASNSAGTAQKDGHVIVEFKPNFANTPYSETYGWVNHESKIKCVSDGVPVPIITWFKGDTEIEAGGNYGISNERGVRQLTGILTVEVNIENQEEMFGTYTCEARNLHDSVRHDILLKKATVPGTPSVTFGDVTATTIDLLISPPANNGGQSVLDYKIVYHVVGQPDNFMNRQADVSKDPGEPRSRFQIIELDAKTLYRITVEARNNVGYGKPIAVTEETKAVTVPGTPTITSPADSTSANEYMLTWTKPQTGGTELTGYSIKFKQVEVSADNEVKHVVGLTHTIQLTNGNLTSTTLKELNPDAHYELQLTAHNSIGESMAQSHLFKTPKGGMPVAGGAVSMHVSRLFSLLLLLPAAAAITASEW